MADNVLDKIASTDLEGPTEWFTCEDTCGVCSSVKVYTILYRGCHKDNTTWKLYSKAQVACTTCNTRTSHTLTKKTPARAPEYE